MQVKLDTPTDTKAPTDPIAEATKKEKERILTLLLSKAAPMASDYRQLIKHTGGLIETSMTYAYSKGIQDVIKLLIKEGTNEKSVQKSA